MWVYEDGTKVAPSDIMTRARLFEKMLKNLDRQDLAELDALIGARRLDCLSEDLARKAEIARSDLRAIALEGLAAVETRDRPAVEAAEARLAGWVAAASAEGS